MKIHALAALVAVTFLLQAQIEKVFGQGALTPPAGPAPTMKSLDQIESRIPISSLPYNITNSGSYYVTTNLMGVNGSHGIMINASDVSIDLRGFVLTGVPGSIDGIAVLGGYTNIYIANGHLEAWSHGVNAYSYGSSWNLMVENLGVAGCSSYAVFARDQSTIRNCNLLNNFAGVFVSSGSVVDVQAVSNALYGIQISIQGSVEHCRASGNGYIGIYVGDGSVLGCISEGNGYDGINLSGLAKDCSANNNTNNGIFDTTGSIIDCSASGNNSSGVYATGPVQVNGDTASGNGAYGFYLLSQAQVDHCLAVANNSDNFNLGTGCTVSHCVADRSLTGNGFTLTFQGRLSDSEAYSNKLDGISADQRSAVYNSIANFNGNAGVRAAYISTVRDCQCTENAAYGIISDGGGVTDIIRNTCTHDGTTALGGSPATGAGIMITNSPGCRVEGNTVSFCNYGLIVAQSQRCLVFHNVGSYSVTAGFAIGSGNSYGPIVNVAAVGDISTVTSANNPQANFNY